MGLVKFYSQIQKDLPREVFDIILVKIGNFRLAVILGNDYVAHELYSTGIWFLAVKTNSIIFLQWLHKNNKEGCSKHIMDYAAYYGNLEHIKWLHTERSEGCTENAMKWAINNDHLDIVKFLYANRTEDDREKAINFIFDKNAILGIEWLNEINYYNNY